MCVLVDSEENISPAHSDVSRVSSGTEGQSTEVFFNWWIFCL